MLRTHAYTSCTWQVACRCPQLFGPSSPPSPISLGAPPSPLVLSTPVTPSEICPCLVLSSERVLELLTLCSRCPAVWWPDSPEPSHRSARHPASLSCPGLRPSFPPRQGQCCPDTPTPLALLSGFLLLMPPARVAMAVAWTPCTLDAVSSLPDTQPGNVPPVPSLSAFRNRRQGRGCLSLTSPRTT